MRLEFVKKLPDGLFWKGRDDVAQDEQVIEEDALLAVTEEVLESLDAVQSTIDEDFMFGHL